MDRRTYNECISRALKGQQFAPGERKSEFCIAAKECSGKASSREEAKHMCDESAAKPKATKSRKSRKGGNGGGGGNASLVLLTTTGCKPCAAAKNYLQGQIDNGTVKVLDVQKDDFAADLAAKAKIVSVPKLLVLDAEGNPFSEIQITDQEQMI